MKQFATKSALRRFMAVILLTMGTVSASAQYYMNIQKNDGTKTQYVVNDIDSIWFTSSTIAGHEYVDLGLSVKWATCNVGAQKPEQYGNLYSWGETETKQVFEARTYKWYYNIFYISKYCTNSNYGTVDNKTTLDPADDVAYVKWGGGWRMPTKAELEELVNNCTLVWTKMNNINGCLITSKKEGYTDRSIFIPAAGFKVQDFSEVGTCGIIWSSTLFVYKSANGREVTPHYANILNLDPDEIGVSSGDRHAGFSIRPVCP